VPVRRVLLALTVFSAALLVTLGVRERRHRLRLERDAHAAAQSEAAAGAGSLDQTLAVLAPMANQLAADVGAHRYTRDQLGDVLKKTVEARPFILEAGIAYTPYAFRPDLELFAPHYLRQGGTARFYQRESYGDYRQREWFRSPIVRGTSWSEPELGHGSGELIIGVGAPLYAKGADGGAGAGGAGRAIPIGVVRINSSVSALQETVSALTAGRTHYGYLLSAGGTYVTHPLGQYVQQLRTVFDVAGEREDPALRECARRALAGQIGEAESSSELTGKPAWVFCQPVPVNGWVLALVYEKAELLAPPHQLRREQLHVLLAGMLVIAALLCVGLRVETLGMGRLWVAAVSLALMLAFGLGLVWSELRAARVAAPAGRDEIFDHATLRAFEAANATQVQGVRTATSTFIPAGIYISTLSLPRPGEAVITGLVWQKYRKGPEDGIARGFIFPDAEQVAFTEAYRRTSATTDVIGWSFRATLRQAYSDSSRYPFDGASLRIRMWHKEFDKAMVLVPDLDAYALMIPGSLPGLQAGLSMPGWNIQQTFFDYARSRLGSDFGISTFAGELDAPELGFNVVAKREFLDPFFASLMPIAVVNCILFVLLLCGRRDEKERDRFGFKPMTALSVAAGTLFVILVAHNNMRSRVAANEIIFLELFYFVAYATIILVAANAIAITRAKANSWVHSGDNLGPKIAFWPVTLLVFLAITIAQFY
jgi:hypothetical protein